MQHFPKDYVLANDGDMDQSLFILINGKLGIFKGDIQIAEFDQKGTIVGEMSVILNEPRTATIKTITECHISVIKADLRGLVQKHPEIAQKLMKTIAKRLSKTTKDYWKLAEKVNYLADINMV